jgi:hypothetical protein
MAAADGGGTFGLLPRFGCYLSGGSLTHPTTLPARLGFLRRAVPPVRPLLRSRGARSSSTTGLDLWSAGTLTGRFFGGDGRASQVPGGTLGRMPCSLTPAEPLAPGHCGVRVLSPVPLRGRPRRDVHFEAPSHGLRPRCLRFAGALAVPPTQDSLLPGGQPLPGGPHTRRVPSGEFPALLTRVYITFLLPQALPGARRVAPSRCF